MIEYVSVHGKRDTDLVGGNATVSLMLSRFAFRKFYILYLS